MTSKEIKLRKIESQETVKYCSIVDYGGDIKITEVITGKGSSNFLMLIDEKDKFIQEKIADGYQDVTDTKLPNTPVRFKGIVDSDVKELIKQFQKFVKDKIKEENYSGNYKTLFHDDIKEETELSAIYKTKVYTDKTMSNNKFALRQSLFFDILRGQIEVNVARQIPENKDKTILEALGVVVEKVDCPEELLDTFGNKEYDVYKVTNLKAQEEFDNFVSAADNKETKLLPLAINKENLFNFLIQKPKLSKEGLYGKGFCFLDAILIVDQFVCLYDVHIGKQQVSSIYEPMFQRNNRYNTKKYNSLRIEQDVFLSKINKYIVYNQEQYTPRYIVRFK